MSDSFVHEFSLNTYSHIEKEIDIRLSMGGFLFNAVLKEAFKKMNLIKQSKLWEKAKKSPNRKKLILEALKKNNFSDYSLQKFAIATKNQCDIGKHLDTHVCQKLATRAYLAVDKYMKNIRGRPRFKRKGWLSSLEGKDNKAGIRFRGLNVYWKGLVIPVIFDKKDKSLIQNHALKSKVKFCRIVRKKIKGRFRYFLQLILEGRPLIKKKNRVKNSVVGLDLGPSSIAIFSKEKAELKAFCEELEPFEKNMKLLQRKLDRSKRIKNPQNYEKNAAIKKSKLFWSYSSRYKRNKNVLSEYFRKLKEYRKRLQGKLANDILKLGNIVKLEKISYKGWQKNFGKSIAKRSPGIFLNILRRKVENTGGQLEEFATKTTCLSQVCHQCEKKKKKQLSQRWHTCCGMRVQRDLYSAFLACHVKNNILDICQAKLNWPGAQLLLERAISSLNQKAIGKTRLASFGLSGSQSFSLVKDRSDMNNAKNVVGLIPRVLESL